MLEVNDFSQTKSFVIITTIIITIIIIIIIIVIIITKVTIRNIIYRGQHTTVITENLVALK